MRTTNPLDQILSPTASLRDSPKNALVEIQKAFNQSLDNWSLSTSVEQRKYSTNTKTWKSTHKAAHFRPIAVSSCLGRVLEKILADRLQLYCVASEIFNNQCGFQTNRSTTDLLALLLNDARTGLDNFEPCHLVIQRLTDTVWHDGILFKLSRFYLINGKILLNGYSASFLGDLREQQTTALFQTGQRGK